MRGNTANAVFAAAMSSALSSFGREVSTQTNFSSIVLTSSLSSTLAKSAFHRRHHRADQFLLKAKDDIMAEPQEGSPSRSDRTKQGAALPRIVPRVWAQRWEIHKNQIIEL